MKPIELLWESFHFYTTEISKHEDFHQKSFSLIDLVLAKHSSELTTADFLFIKEFQKINRLLIHLYNKQNHCLKDIINYTKTANNIPLEYETDSKSLYSLLEINGDLIDQIQLYLDRIKKIS